MVRAKENFKQTEIGLITDDWEIKLLIHLSSRVGNEGKNNFRRHKKSFKR